MEYYYRMVCAEDGAVKSVSMFDHEPGSVPLGYITTDAALGGADPRELRGTIVDGQVVGMEVVTEPAVYLHLGISGGDGDTPPGIVNDGVAAIQVDIALRASADPGSPVLPVSGDWRVTIRDDTGAIYDVVRLTITNGQAQVSYTSNQRPAVCQVLERDFYPVTVGGVSYQVRLAGSAEFKVYRVL